MATVTKLKATVNNKNLPILGSDGKLHNYFVGRYVNKLAQLGYELTSVEETALEAFISDGISKGWIDKVKYLMPFIGSEEIPLTGMVPLIDKISDYELAVDSVAAEIFTYNNGKITNIGSISDASKPAYIPVTSTMLGAPQTLGCYFNINYVENASIKALQGGICSAYNQDENVRFAIRKGNGNASEAIFWGVKFDDSSSISFANVKGTAFDTVIQKGIFTVRYVDNNNNKRVKRYVINKGASTALEQDMSGNTASADFPNEVLTYKVGNSQSSNSVCPINIIAFINPIEITSDDMYNFNQAVFALTTALGRNV